MLSQIKAAALLEIKPKMVDFCYDTYVSCGNVSDGDIIFESRNGDVCQLFSCNRMAICISLGGLLVFWTSNSLHYQTLLPLG